MQRGKSCSTPGSAQKARRESTPPGGVMSDFGWGTCYSCHPDGLNDSVTWMFADGPRQAISMESTATLSAGVIANGAPLPDSHQRALNWSAVRDEVQDFERNIRAVSGGGGLILAAFPRARRPRAGSDLVARRRPPGGTPTSTRSPPIWPSASARRSPRSRSGTSGRRGRVVFEAADCQNCHGGPNWTSSRLDFTPPPAAARWSARSW